MRRNSRINVEWLTPNPNFTWEHVAIEVLMDIREQLRKLNATMDCHNTRDIPVRLRSIDRRLASAFPRRKK